MFVKTTPRRRDIRNDLREAIAAHQSEKDYKTISKRSPAETQLRLCNVQRNLKNTRATPQTLQASIPLLNVEVDDSTITKRLYDLFVRLQEKASSFSLKKNMT